MKYILTKKALMLDLYAAFLCAKQHKSNKPYVKTFEKNLMKNLESLADDLLARRYKPEPSSCFIVERPMKREVFAAQFRDRVVHHLYYNYTHVLFEHTFIADSYSCIPGRGTHYGIERLRHHILSESRNYQRKCYVMSLDVRGYFMHIKREFLLDIATKTIEKMRSHRVCVDTKQTWGEYLDIDFVLWLTKEIIMLDPTKKCRVVGKKEDWNGLDRNKSLFWTNEGCGLPIGNLTSQLFSNVYLNVYDQFVKRVLKFKHFGRYVDDSYIVCHDKKKLLESVQKIREFQKETLEVNLHMGKLQIREVGIGAEFLGAFIKPYRSYISNATLYRTKVSMSKLNLDDKESTYRSINSFLGTLGHYSSYNIRCNLFMNKKMLSVASFEKGLLKMNKPFNINNFNSN